MAAYAISTICPSCRHTAYTKVKPDALVAFAEDRVCTQCGTRYSPPAPWWAAAISLVGGLGGAVASAWYIRHELEHSSRGRVPTGGVTLGVASVLLIMLGIKCVWSRTQQRSGGDREGADAAQHHPDPGAFRGFASTLATELALRVLFIPLGLGALVVGGYAGAGLYAHQVPKPDLPAARVDYDHAEFEAWDRKADAWNNGQGLAMLAGAAATFVPTALVWRRIYRRCRASAG